MLKTCNRCNVEQPLTAFYIDNKRVDGHFSVCKECSMAQSRARKAKNAASPISNEPKTCLGCGETKTADEFSIQMGGKGNRNPKCKVCRAQKTSDWYQENKERICAERKASYDPESERAKSLRYSYNMTLDQYDEMLEAQNGVCASCGDVSRDGKRLHVDHDHSCCSANRSCGKCIRALLCNGCNQAEGYLRSDPNRALALAAYMIQHQTTKPEQDVIQA